MKYQTYNIPSQPLNSAHGAYVSSLEYQAHDHSLLCGLMFSNPSLFRVKLDNTSNQAPEFKNCALEDYCGDGLLGVTQGLKSYTSGESALTVLHKGFLPAFLGGDTALKLKAFELLDKFKQESGGMGGHIRHSVLQLDHKHNFKVRMAKDSGVLIDSIQIGDFVFGLCGDSIWREPYLNPEKRETVRKGLDFNASFHRDADGLFWFLSNNGRLARMNTVDTKAKPTPIKLNEAGEAEDFGFFRSSASRTDGWLYGIGRSKKDLFRIRMNPESKEENYQHIATLGSGITSVVCLDNTESSDQATPEQSKPGQVLLFCEAQQGKNCQVLSFETHRADDPELIPPVPNPQLIGEIEGVQCIGQSTVDQQGRVWAGEGYLGQAQEPPQTPRLICLEL